MGNNVIKGDTGDDNAQGGEQGDDGLRSGAGSDSLSTVSASDAVR